MQKRNAMVPNFHPFDLVMVDSFDTTPSPPGAFLTGDGVGQAIKLVEMIEGSDPTMVRIKNRNPVFSAFDVPLDRAVILGRVIGRWQRP